MAKFQPKICKECGKEFIPRTGVQTFCDREHYRPCPVCGVEVLNTRLYEPAKCCSRKCSKEYTKIKNLQKYGTEHPMQNDSVKQHFKQAMLDKYGVESPLQSDEIKQRAIQTNQEKFGTDWSLANEQVYSKAQETMTERYGAKTTLESKELSEKVHDTIVARYGVDNSMQSDEVRQKSAQTMLERYGVENPAKSPELKAKAVATRIEKYGHHKFNNILANMKSDYTVTDTAHEVSEYSRMLTEYNVVHDTYYKLDSEIYDIYIPNKDLLLCINSTTEVMTTDKSCHRSKTKIATDNGYRCIHVFDWDDREAILNLVKDKQKVYARDCSIHEINKESASNFINKYHLQGDCRGAKYQYGLFYKGFLIQVMTFGTPRYNSNYQYELLRLCTAAEYYVVGGAERMFKHFCRDCKPTSIISYCDTAKFSGDVYTRLGFKYQYTTAPTKIWSYKKNKITNNLLLQRGFDQLFNTNYGKGTDNETLMIENGWLPVYDCGQAIYTYTTE